MNRRAPKRSSSVSTAILPGPSTNPAASGASTASSSTIAEHLAGAVERTVAVGRDHDAVPERIEGPAQLPCRARRIAGRGTPDRRACRSLPFGEGGQVQLGAVAERIVRRRARRAAPASASAAASGLRVVVASDAARPSVRRASVRTTHAPSGSSSAGVGIVSNRNGRGRSVPSGRERRPPIRARRSATRSSPTDAAAARARSRDVVVERSARARARPSRARPGRSTAASTARTAGSIRPRRPRTPDRTGRRSSAGNTSTTPPRTANSPRCSTTSARSYPSSDQAVREDVGRRLVARGELERRGRARASARSPGWPRPPARRPRADRPARSRRTVAARRAATSGLGDSSSYGSASHAGSSAAPAREERVDVGDQRLGLVGPRGDGEDGKFERGRESREHEGLARLGLRDRPGAHARAAAARTVRTRPASPPAIRATSHLPDNTESPGRGTDGAYGAVYRGGAAQIACRPRCGFLRSSPSAISPDSRSRFRTDSQRVNSIADSGLEM